MVVHQPSWKSIFAALVVLVCLGGGSFVIQLRLDREIEGNETILRETIIDDVNFDDTPLHIAIKILNQKIFDENPGWNPSLIQIEKRSEKTRERTDEDREFAANFGFDLSSDYLVHPDTSITLQLKDIPAAEAIRYTAALAMSRYRVTPLGVRIVPHGYDHRSLLEKTIDGVAGYFRRWFKL